MSNQPIVRCIRKGHLVGVTREQYNEYLNDNFSAHVLTKKQFKEELIKAGKLRLQKSFKLEVL